jgi:DNA-binding LytR/AlgR family response regulator
MPTALIADDEAHLSAYLAELLSQCWPEIKVIARPQNGIEALQQIDELVPDIAFLDIRMPGIDGLEVARRLVDSPKPPRLVFVTAYDQYAVEAFEREAVDYLLKPPTLERLARTVARLKAALGAEEKPTAAVPDTTALLARLAEALGRPAPVNVPAVPRLEWIRAAQGQETRLIAVEEVIYFQANDKYISVYTTDGESLIRTPLKELLEGLDPRQFWQVHRGTVVAARQIVGTVRDFRGRTLIKLKSRPEQLVVSRTYLHLFRQM